MRKGPKRKYLYPLSLFVFVGIVMMPGILYAELPWLDYQGDFSYVYCTSYRGGGACAKDAEAWELTFSYNSTPGLDITEVTYMGETSPTTNGSDPIFNASIFIGTLYNSDPSGNLHFDDTAGPTGSSVTFSIMDTGYTYLTATLDPVDLYDIDPTYFILNLDNVSNIIFDPNEDAPYSRYIDELQQTTDIDSDGYGDYSIDYGMSFSRTSGDAGFTTGDSSGSVQGNLKGGPIVPVIPEPGSSILFVTGGATLLARRYLRKKIKTSLSRPQLTNSSKQTIV